MKKFFTRYLPVDGKLNEGDKVLVSRSIGEFIGTVVGGKVIGDKSIGDMRLEYPLNDVIKKKVELFLCTNDVEVGDEVCDFDDTSLFAVIKRIDGDSLFSTIEGIEEEIELTKGNVLKVIARVSPYATWMTEREVDESELEFWGEHNDDEGWMKEQWGELVICNHLKPTIQIKGPCGHYH